ncbi:MAG: WD40 repeat domain-containing protein [Kofleriaceae bacterium]
MASYEITLSGNKVPAGRVHAVVGEVMLQANAHPWRVEVDERAGVATRARLVAPNVPSRAVDVWLAVDLVDAITAATGWAAFDPQRDLELGDHAHPWRAEKVLAAEQVSSLASNEGQVLIGVSPWTGSASVWRWNLRRLEPQVLPLAGGKVMARFEPDGGEVVAGRFGVGLDHVMRLRRGALEWLPMAPCRDFVAIDGGQVLTSRAQRIGLATGVLTPASTDDAWRVAASANGQRVVLGDRVYDSRGGVVAELVCEGHHANVVAMAPGGAFVASGGRDRRVVIFDAHTGAVRTTFDRCGSVRAIAISPDEKLIATGADTPRISLWTPEGDLVAKLVATGTPRVWDGIRGPILPDAKESGRHVEHVAFLDDTHVIAAFSDGRLCVYDLATFAPVATIGLFAVGQWIALAPDGTWDGSPGLTDVQWHWSTDAREYRDIVILDPAKHRRGWLVGALELS